MSNITYKVILSHDGFIFKKIWTLQLCETHKPQKERTLQDILKYE